MPSDTTVDRLVETAGRSHPVTEFLRALGEAETYRIWHNTYALFGFLWGLPIPFFCAGLQWWCAGCIVSWPLTIIFALHPFLFAILFGAMGSVRSRKDRHIQSLLTQLRANVDQLQELDRLRNEFVANVTHELKTPLVAIRGYNEMMIEGRLGPITDKQREGLQTSVRNIDRLQRQIEDLLQIERIDSGRLNVEAEPFELKPLIEDCLEIFAPGTQARQVSLKSVMPPEPVWVTADRDMIAHVLSNLLGNAVKFVADRGEVRVEVVNGRPDVVTVRVVDDGCGIPAEARPYIFERFRQADGSSRRKYGGVGLGLSIVRGILEAHRSAFRVTSGEGRGTTVEFDLPVVSGRPT